MIVINEWLPNPTGADAKGEWIEILNNGRDAQNLSGWQITTKMGKAVALKGNINPGEFLVLKRGEFKISLRNTDEAVFLYDEEGALIDQSVLLGTAQEGKSFSRIARHSLGEGGTEGQIFSFAEPTPGAPNVAAPAFALIQEVHPFDTPLAPPMGTAGFLEMAIGAALALAVATVIVIRKNEEIRNTLFGGN